MTALFGPCRGTCTRLDTSIQGDSATGTCKRVAIQIHNSTALSLRTHRPDSRVRPAAPHTRQVCRSAHVRGGSVGVQLHHARPSWLSRRERHGAEDAAGSCGKRRRVGESEGAGNAGGAMVRAWIANPGKQTLSAC